jgi:hypothetical protein
MKDGKQDRTQMGNKEQGYTNRSQDMKHRKSSFGSLLALHSNPFI